MKRSSKYWFAYISGFDITKFKTKRRAIAVAYERRASPVYCMSVRKVYRRGRLKSRYECIREIRLNCEQ